MPHRKAKLLLANDDGIDAAGIRALHAALRQQFDVLVVAPSSERSGAGCSLSLSNEMEIEERHEDGKIWGYAVNGTPADCVKFALTALEGYKPDLVLSGINRGLNMGNSVFYSGTVAAAIEATLYGYPAMACSLGCWGEPVAHYDDAAVVVRQLVPWLLSFDHEPRTLWNINFPNLRLADYGPLRMTTHGTSFYEDVIELHRQEGDRRFYRNTGLELRACTRKHDSDDKAVARGEISLSLLRTDLTIPVPQATAKALEGHLAGLIKAST